MKSVEFEQESKDVYSDIHVYIDGEYSGFLDFDKEQRAWVYWAKDIDDGVSYFYSLKDTERVITEEVQDFDTDKYEDGSGAWI